MTRKEVIGNLNMIRVAFIDTVTVEQGKIIDDTFRAAIETLKQEPCEDVISRDDVYGILMRTYFRDTCSYEEFKERLEQIPPVTPHETVTEFADRCQECGKMRKGYWIIKENGHVKCSKCLIVHPYPSIFCPSCGAKMSEIPTGSESEGEE